MKYAKSQVAMAQATRHSRRRKTPHKPADARLLRAFNIALLAYVAVIPWELVSTPLGTPVQVFGLLFLATWLIAWAAGAVSARVPPAATLSFMALLVWTLATTLWSVSASVSLVASVSRALLVLAAVAATAAPADAIPRIAQVLAGSTAVMALRVFGAAPTRGYDRLTFDGVDQNALAFNLCIGLACAVFLLVTSVRKSILAINGAVSVVIAGAVILTGSRTGLGSLAGIMAIAVVLAIRRGRYTLALALPFVGAVVWWFVVQSGRTPKRLLAFVESPVVTDSRARIIDQYQVFQSHWELWGIGAGADADFLSNMTGIYKNAHSGFWKTWIELGLIGLVIFVVLLACWLWCTRSSPARLLVWVSLGAVVPFMYTLGPLNANALWLLIGLGFIPLAERSPDSIDAGPPTAEAHTR